MLGQIRVGTEIVVVPVTVRDSDGILETGLNRDDFILLEDGIPQTISSFDHDPQPLSAAIVIDDGMSGNALRQVSLLLFAFTAGIAPNDELITFRYDHVVDKLSDFSNDPKMLEKSFAVIAKIAKGRPQESEELIKGGPGWLRSILSIFPSPATSGSKDRIPHDAIFEAATALISRPMDRRRIIFLISDGASGKTNTHSIGRNSEMLVKNNIQVFAISTVYARFGSYGTLTSYADATGGDVLAGATANSLEHALNQITEQARLQYILGYTSTNKSSPPGVFRKIVVKTHDPKQKVTHRKGYVSLTVH